MQQEQRKLILQLKTIKEELHLSNQQIQDMVEKAGNSVSPSTLHRLFREGGENGSFNYRTTLLPISKVLTETAKHKNVSDMAETLLQAQFDALKSESLLKDGVIKSLTDELEEEKRKVAHLLAQVTRQGKMLDALFEEKERAKCQE